MLAGLLAFIEIPILIILVIVTRTYTAVKREKRIKEAREAFTGKYAEYLASSKKMCDMGEFKLSLAALRNSLEALVKYMCSCYGVPVIQGEQNLLGLIDALAACGGINEAQCSLMHKVRMATNKGSHVELNEEAIIAPEAVSAIKKMEELLSLLYQTHKNILPGMFKKA